MELQELSFESAEYEAAVALRHRMLRVPLGLEWTEEERAWEPVDRHFGALEGEEMVGCVLIRELGEGRVKLRQMAVASDCQGDGVGRALVEWVERLLRAEGVREIELHAREVAAGFYEKLGYVREGERFSEVGIPHWRMVKKWDE